MTQFVDSMKTLDMINRDPNEINDHLKVITLTCLKRNILCIKIKIISMFDISFILQMYQNTKVKKARELSLFSRLLAWGDKSRNHYGIIKDNLIEVFTKFN